MSAVTIHTPGFQLPRRPANVITFPGSRTSRESAAAPVPRRHDVAAPLRLTRRGRLVITIVVAVALVAMGLLGARTAFAGQSAETTSMQEVTVLPGDTLWSIASKGGSGDVRDRVWQIREMNDLQTSQLLVGQELLVPIG